MPATQNETAWVLQLLKTGPDWWGQPNYGLLIFRESLGFTVQLKYYKMSFELRSFFFFQKEGREVGGEAVVGERKIFKT